MIPSARTVGWLLLLAVACGRHNSASYKSAMYLTHAVDLPTMTTALYTNEGLKVGVSAQVLSGATDYEVCVDFLRREDTAPEWAQAEVQLEWDEAGKHTVVPRDSFELIKSDEVTPCDGLTRTVRSPYNRSLHFKARQPVPAIPLKADGMTVTVTFALSRDGRPERVVRRATLERHQHCRPDDRSAACMALSDY